MSSTYGRFIWLIIEKTLLNRNTFQLITSQGEALVNGNDTNVIIKTYHVLKIHPPALQFFLETRREGYDL